MVSPAIATKSNLRSCMLRAFIFFGLRFRPSRMVLLLTCVIISVEFYPRGSQCPVSLTSHQVWVRCPPFFFFFLTSFIMTLRLYFSVGLADYRTMHHVPLCFSMLSLQLSLLCLRVLCKESLARVYPYFQHGRNKCVEELYIFATHDMMSRFLVPLSRQMMKFCQMLCMPLQAFLQAHASSAPHLLFYSLRPCMLTCCRSDRSRGQPC